MEQTRAMVSAKIGQNSPMRSFDYFFKENDLSTLLFDNGFYSTKIDDFNTKKSPFNMDEMPIKNDIFMHGKEEEKII